MKISLRGGGKAVSQKVAFALPNGKQETPQIREGYSWQKEEQKRNGDMKRCARGRRELARAPGHRVCGRQVAENAAMQDGR